jgi:hypothetical protein
MIPSSMGSMQPNRARGPSPSQARQVGVSATDYCVDTTVRAALAKNYPATVPSDGHTTADRPHLSAVQIIVHHNAIWSDFLSPVGPAKVRPCAEILAAD